MTNDAVQVGKREEREGMAGEHSFTDSGQIVLLSLFLITLVLDSFIFRIGGLEGGRVPILFRAPLGLASLTAAFFLMRSAHRAVFGKPEGHAHVITGGVFSLVRHPMYLGSMLFFFGLLVFTLSLPAAAVLLVIVVFYVLVSRYEEKLLTRKYGDEYTAYKERVPMFIPLKFHRRESPGGHDSR
jgi:protein-S-isoprenylcysteine O-methyltransferase Ste14